jgi:hypothetical protein
MTMKSGTTGIARRWTVAAALALMLSACAGSGPAHENPDEIAATVAPDSVPGVPRVVGDAFRRLDGELEPADRDTIRGTPANDMIRYHMGLGMYVRNEYGLWKGGPLQDFFLRKGVQHPDDMSSVLLDAYRLYLRGEPVNLDSIIAAQPPPPVAAPAPPPDSAR